MILLLIVSMAWMVNNYRDNAITFKDQRDKATSALALTNNTIDDMTVRQRDVAALDARYTGELADAKAENDMLLSDVVAGKRRLQIAATYSKETTPGISGVAYGSSPRLIADAELNYLRLRDGIATVTKQLTGLQAYVCEKCVK